MPWRNRFTGEQVEVTIEPGGRRGAVRLRTIGDVVRDYRLHPDAKSATLPAGVKRTFLRPREVLQFTSQAIQRAGKKATFVGKDAIREAEERYSTWKVDDLKQEYRKAVPELEPLLECLREGVHRYDAIEDLVQILRDQQPDILDRLGVRRSLEVLFEASAIGVRPRNSGSPRFRSEDANLSLPVSGAVYVHQGLYKGLAIREARTSD